MEAGTAAFLAEPVTAPGARYWKVKPVIDAIMATSLLVLLAPLIGVIALVVRLTSHGPVYYQGARVGQHGRQFRMLKFRTMVVDAEKMGPASTAATDARLTRVGAWLRRFKLDELPQLVNVLRGDMSFVGPRPEVPWIYELRTPSARRLLAVRPGITDYASLAYRNEAEILRDSVDPDRDYLDKIEPGKTKLALIYLEQASLLIDAKVLLATLMVPFGVDPTWALPDTNGTAAPDVARPTSADTPISITTSIAASASISDHTSTRDSMPITDTTTRSPHVHRTTAEVEGARRVAEIFESSADPIEARLEQFPRYVRRQDLKRFLAMYELFKHVLPLKGSVVECGVYRGFSLMTWAKLSTILEPENITRRIYGFDTFEGFPALDGKDQSPFTRARPGDYGTSSERELRALIAEYDRDRFLGHIPKVELIAGNIRDTAPEFMRTHPHLLVSLLFLDADLYEPTRTAIETFVPRMPKGSVIAFDELDNPIWPGETLALLETLGIRDLRLQRVEFDPYIAFAFIE